MIALFTDFDGVLNSPATSHLPGMYALDPDKVQRLGKLADRLNAVIVVSSSWRFIYMAEQFPSMLAMRGLTCEERVVGVTPTHIEDRADAIRSWVRRNRPHEYLIFDDLGFETFGNLWKRLIQTNGSVGLTDEDVARAVRRLQRFV